MRFLKIKEMIEKNQYIYLYLNNSLQNIKINIKFVYDIRDKYSLKNVLSIFLTQLHTNKLEGTVRIYSPNILAELI